VIDWILDWGHIGIVALIWILTSFAVGGLIAWGGYRLKQGRQDN
jgi:hypothetical protein